MNFSNWGEYKIGRKINLLQDICKLVKGNSMPLPIYITMHGEAKLTDAERLEICTWAQGAAARLEANVK